MLAMAAAAMASSRGLSSLPSVAKAHTVLDRFCGLNSSILLIAAPAITSSSSSCLTCSFANAHTVLATSRGSAPPLIVLMAADAIASMSGSSNTSSVAKAQTVLESSWDSNCGQISRACADIAASRGSWSKPSVAKDHAVFDKFCPPHSDIFWMNLSAMAYRSVWSDMPSVAHDHEMLVRFCGCNSWSLRSAATDIAAISGS
mmetsp:Transcript_46852/g.123816  ORF Transcript_46852/g.123816 Transcript_46852/m.123816 type:complete len:202 (-) Transcript_46852:949-1554(-)